MPLSYLEVRDLRNLTSTCLEPISSINLIVGPNGSGKTSLLEAINIIGLGRSFRTAQLQKYIQKGKNTLIVFARVERNGVNHTIGVQKSSTAGTLIHVDRQVVLSSARLAELLPLQLITPESHQLLQGEPVERRAFLDWGLFHVEHGYHSLWKRYRRLLEQRNAALRTGVDARHIKLWDEELAEAGNSLTVARKGYLAALLPYFTRIYSYLLDGARPELSYRQGWNRELALLDALQLNREKEMTLGYTLSGPQRADIRIRLENGLEAVDGLSRGQQKLAVCALRLAQMQHLHDEHSINCTLLLDDLPAELDAERRIRLMTAVAHTRAQCFITATDLALFNTSAWPEMKVFHVEHGGVKEVV